MGDLRYKDRDNEYMRLCAVLFMLLALAAVLLSGCDIDNNNGSGAAGDAEIGKAAVESEKVLIDEVPEWSGSPYVVINNNVPDFSTSEIKKARTRAVRKGRRYESFSELDGLGRCGPAEAVVSRSTMPDGERGSIGMIKPSGWRLDKYDFIDNGGYLYNRCHLIGWQLTGQNDEERNLITGTRYLNVEGMLPFENQVAEYVRQTGGHVLLRAAPVFRTKELVARGVQLVAYSLEDGGAGLSFNVYCYNVQPGVRISYKTGKSMLDPETVPEGAETDAVKGGASANGETDSEKAGGSKDGAETDSGKAGGSTDGADTDSSKGGGASEGKGESTEYPPLDVPEGVTYILNKNTMRFHRTDCKGARTIREHNREWFYGTRDEAVDAGYIPCGMCEP